MSFPSNKTSRLLWMSFAMIMSLVVSAGCYRRAVAPELTYDQSKVEVLDNEIEKFEW